MRYTFQLSLEKNPIKSSTWLIIHSNLEHGVYKKIILYSNNETML